MESLQNGLQPQSGGIPLFSIKGVSLQSSWDCRSVNAGAQCKRALRGLNYSRKKTRANNVEITPLMIFKVLEGKVKYASIQTFI